MKYVEYLQLFICWLPFHNCYGTTHVEWEQEKKEGATKSMFMTNLFIIFSQVLLMYKMNIKRNDKKGSTSKQAAQSWDVYDRPWDNVWPSNAARINASSPPPRAVQLCSQPSAQDPSSTLNFALSSSTLHWPCFSLSCNKMQQEELPQRLQQTQERPKQRPAIFS